MDSLNQNNTTHVQVAPVIPQPDAGFENNLSKATEINQAQPPEIEVSTEPEAITEDIMDLEGTAHEKLEKLAHSESVTKEKDEARAEALPERSELQLKKE